MHVIILVLRLIHLINGVFWAGTIFFLAMFLEPTVRNAGPAGGAIMQGLEKRGFVTLMPVFAWLAILSGVGLLWIDSAGFSSVFMGSGSGIAYSIGALGAVGGVIVGLSMVRPTTIRMGQLMGEAAKIPEGPARDAHLAPAAALRQKLTRGVRLTAALVAVAVVAMAVARYAT